MIAWSSLFRDAADRSAAASKTQHKLNQDGWITQIIQQSQRIAIALRHCQPAALQAHTERLCLLARQQSDVADAKLLSLAAGAVIESVRQTLGLRLFEAQLHAGIVISCGAVAEMQTGEGKTLAGVLPAYVQSLHGRGVHVATTNAYLAGRDFQQLSPVFSRLGLTTGLLTNEATTEQTQAAYRADITYGTGHAFGFDFLRDQLTFSQTESQQIGTASYDRICGNAPEARLRQRPLHAAIVDEIDHVLIDDAASPLILSASSQGDAADAEIHIQARILAKQLVCEADYHINHSHRSIELTDRGLGTVYENDLLAAHCQLRRPWHEYVVLALRAEHLFHRDVHYVVKDQEVQIVDESTGRIFADRSWSDGLHQAVLAAENLPITPENSSLAKITRQRFYRHYKTLGGMTGTARGCEKEFRSVYGLAVCQIPLRMPSRRRLEPMQLCQSVQAKFELIADETETLHRCGRAVLIGTLNIAQSQTIASELRRRGLPFQLLNGVQDAEEAAIIARAGQPAAITVATNLAGRGTDIKLDPAVSELGGLHVIVAEHHALARVDRQLIGRCARCGDPGSARFYLSPDDQLFRQSAPWIARAIKRSDKHGDFHCSLAKQVTRAQAEMQSKATSIRWQMLHMDRENESLLDPSDNLSGCWQM